MEANFNELNTMELAYRTLRDGRYYFAGEDRISEQSPGYLMEYLIGKVRLYERSFVIQDTVDRALRFTYWGAKRDEADAFIDVVSASEYWDYSHGHFYPKYGSLSDKEFFPIRGFLTSLCSGKLPKDFKMEGAAGFYKGVKMFFYDESECKFNGFGGLMMDERLSMLIDQSEKMRVVQDGILRTAIRTKLGWIFKTTNSLGEYHFDYDKGEGKITCKYCIGNTKTYSIGKGLSRIAMIMGATPPTEKQVKEVSMWLKSYGKGTLEVVEGHDIARWYSWHCYESDLDVGSLSSSCMKHDEFQHCVDNMYRGNAKMLILRSVANPDKLLGRALLWDFDGHKIMDRIYGAEYNYGLFKKWASENGYTHRKRQTYGDPHNFIAPDGSEVALKLKYKLNRLDYLSYDDMEDFYDYDDDYQDTWEGKHALPYMDTFKYVNMSENTIQNYAPDIGECGEWLIMENTAGVGDVISTQYSMSYKWNN